MTFQILNNEYDGELQFKEYDFELSNFQKWSIDSWRKNKNVLITAHTGSGKTLPAEDAINQIICNNLGKVIYTSPIKSLSNDKYNSLKKKFPDADIGIITGDIKFNPNATVIIMTTEILRNLLYNNKIEDIKNKVTIEININEIHTVIFDEVHYINDVDRGTVWEECFILLPSVVNLICLSATIDNPEHFCNWLSKIKNKDIILTSTEKRIVPLRHCIFIDYLHSFLNKKEGFSSEDFNNKLITFSDENNMFNVNEYVRVMNHIKNTQNGMSNNQIINNLIHYLNVNTLTPAIFFVFSRKGCEKLANSVHHTLLDNIELSLVDKIIKHYLKKTNNYESYIKMKQYKSLRKCLDKGIAYHHSGLLPIFKELVEILFSYKNIDNQPQPLVKVLFATETFAVGVNMPTKVVIFTSLEKFTNNEMRYLKSHEFLQMAGRAGRRGIDSSGLVILLPNMNMLPNEKIIKSMLLGKSQIIESKFKPNYKIIIKSIINGNDISYIVKQSLVTKELTSQLDEKTTELNKLDFPDIDLEKVNEYIKIKNKDYGYFKPTKKTLKENSKKIKILENDTTFMQKYKFYIDNKDIIDTKKKLYTDINNNINYLSDQVNKIIDILLDKNYLEKKQGMLVVTLKGIIATEINECNEFILTELILHNYLDNLNYKQIGAILSIFGDSKIITDHNENIDVPKIHLEYIYQNILQFIEKTAKDHENIEIYKYLYINTNWNYSTDIMGATYDWLNGKEFDEISHIYNIYEGNLIKDFIKIYNIAANVSSISRILKKNNLEVECNKLMDNIMKDIVTIESLYINN